MPHLSSVPSSNVFSGPMARPGVPTISIEERKIIALEDNSRAMLELATEMRLFRQEREDRIRRSFRETAIGAAA